MMIRLCGRTLVLSRSEVLFNQSCNLTTHILAETSTLSWETWELPLSTNGFPTCGGQVTSPPKIRKNRKWFRVPGHRSSSRERRLPDGADVV